jgi:hypothetical protein
LISLALVVETKKASVTEIKEVSSAVQRQLSRDFGPIWGLEATIDAFRNLDDVPPGYWPIIVRDDFPGMNIIGIHLDQRNQPFSLVRLSPTWSLTVSHEALEMVSDPWGNRLVPGGSPLPGQGLVEFLIEVCDPVGGVAHAYTVNGHLVSDFYTPHYFDPVASPGVRYSFTGALQRPRDVLPGGYLSWREPSSQEWWQRDWVNRREPRFIRLGRLTEDGRPLRERIDSQLTMPDLYYGAPPDHPNVVAAQVRRVSAQAASRASAAALRRRVAEITGASIGAAEVASPPRPHPSSEPEPAPQPGPGSFVGPTSVVLRDPSRRRRTSTD